MNLKQSFAMLLSIVLLLTCCSPVYALDGPEDTEDPDDITTLHHDYYAIAHDETLPAHINLEQKPSNIPSLYARNAYVTEQAWASSGIGIYYQDDIDPSITCSGGTPLSTVGCAVTSTAMVIQKYDVYMTPAQVFYALLGEGGIHPNCNMIWNPSAFSRALYGITMEHWNNTNGGNYLESVGKSVIEGILRTGKPVIVGLKKNDQRHFVVCYGYEKYSDGGSYHYLFNPSIGGAQTLEWYMAQWYIESFTTLYR